MGPERRPVLVATAAATASKERRFAHEIVFCHQACSTAYILQALAGLL